jgi:hypothetical protein
VNIEEKKLEKLEDAKTLIVIAKKIILEARLSNTCTWSKDAWIHADQACTFIMLAQDEIESNIEEIEETNANARLNIESERLENNYDWKDEL